MVAFLTALNTLSPVAVIGLLGCVIFYMVRFASDFADKYDVLTSNHLHDLPAMTDSLATMNETLQRIEVGQARLIAITERGWGAR